MATQVIKANGEPGEQVAEQLHYELLTGVNEAAGGNLLQTTTLSEKWNDLRNAINPFEDKERFDALRTAFEKDRKSWIEDLFSKWIAHDNKEEIKHEFTRLSAIRMLASVAGRDEGDGSVVFEKLWSVIENDRYAVDARAWALFSLWLCNHEVDSEGWNETFGRAPQGTENGDAGYYWLESVPEAKVRARSVQAIGEMARHAEMAFCWNASPEESCAEKLNRCRLRNERELFENVEEMLLAHWGREIDYSVTYRLIDALAFTAGWFRLPQEVNWDVIDVLKAASRSPDYQTRSRVPGAIVQIATNIIHRRNGNETAEKKALTELLDLAVDRIKMLASPERRDAARSIFEQQRHYLVALRRIAQTALEDGESPQNEAIISMAVRNLLDIADGFPGPETNDREAFRNQGNLRRLALFYVSELAELSDLARHFVVGAAVERCKLMLADPLSKMAREAANALVTLMGEKEAATYFVEVIIEDVGVEEAISYRNENWQLQQDAGNEELKREMRTLAADTLGTIRNNGAAHDKLVETLRSDALRSSRARDALIVMGGERAVESIVNYNTQQLVNDKFFEPMEKARERGWQLLEDVRWMSRGNYNFARTVALATIAIGLLAFLAGTYQQLFGGSDLEFDPLLAGGIGLSSLGAIGVYLWDPVKGMNKVSAELSRLIMSFENYLGRMRLIGLGFAHAYTQNRFDQLHFLNNVSQITAQAMRESAISLEDIGEWPKFQLKKAFAVVPSLLDKPIAEARRIAEDARMELKIGEPIFQENTTPETVIAQEPAPGLYVGKETAIKVTPATNRRPNVDVPDFGGATILEAFNLAQNKGLQIKAFALDFDAGTEEGQVIAQDLRVGLNVVQGTPISLTIAKKTEPTLTDDGS